MCGISGIASVAPVAPANRGWLQEGLSAMRHRGPDDVGEWWTAQGNVGFGHRRLAIQDLSVAGHQPMHDDHGVSIVFNGEIYNFLDLRKELAAAGHPFRSRSDTEVILAAYREWGNDCLVRLNGMFAFALYDSAKQRLLLARDRAGEKPLFYALDAQSLRFASELKGLLSDPHLPRRIDLGSLDCYLTMGYVPGGRCILEGLNKLPPAHALHFDLRSGKADIWRYWSAPPLADAQSVVHEDELLEELESLLEAAVRRQLIADVPVGVLLSGGVDSSLVTAMAVRSATKVKTFTVVFPGDRRFDESSHARLIADHFQTEHTELSASHVSPEILPKLARQFDEPMVDSSMIPTYLVSALIRKHCTVALGGDGGDELFGGYGHHSRLVRLSSVASRVPPALRRPLATTAGRLLPIGFKGRAWAQSLGCDFSRDLPFISALFDVTARRELLSGHGGWLPIADAVRRGQIPDCSDIVQRVTRMDFATYLAEDILVKVDRASMLNSLEVRAPLLDHRLIEFAFAKVPSRLKATANARKILLKRLAGRVFPPQFDRQRKQGFSIPLNTWLKGGEWHDYFRDVLLDDVSPFFDRGMVESLLRGQERGRNNAERLFSLTMLELWRREYCL